MSTLRVSQQYPIASFIVVAFAFTWFWWFLAISIGVVGSISLPLTAIGSFGPAVAAILVTRSGSDLARARRRYWGTFAVLALLAGGIFALKLVTGGRSALRDAAFTSDVSLDPASILFVVLVVLIAAWSFASARSTDGGIRAHMRTLLQWRVSVWFWAFALAVMPTVFLLGAGLTIAVGGSLPTPAFFAYDGTGAIGLLAVAFLYGAVFGGGNEEIGWRGFMLPALQSRYSPLVASLILAIVWSLWHLPLHMGGFYGPQQSILTAMAFRTLWMIPSTILLTWLYNRTGGNLLLMVVLHTTVSFSALVMPATFLSLVPGTLLIVGLVVEGRMWQRLPATKTGGKTERRTS